MSSDCKYLVSFVDQLMCSSYELQSVHVIELSSIVSPQMSSRSHSKGG